MYVDAHGVAKVGSNAMALGSSVSLMLSGNAGFLFNDFSAVLVERVLHCEVDLVVATANALPKRWYVAMWRDARVTV